MIAAELESYQQQHQRFQQDHSASSPNWLSDLRQRAISQFVDLGIPIRKIEDWRFTNVGVLGKRPYQISQSVSLEASVVRGLVERASLDDSFDQLVFVNGHFSEQWSTIHEAPEGVMVGSLAATIRDRSDAVERQVGTCLGEEVSAFTALNTAFISDGAWIEIPENVVLDRPIHLMFLSVGETLTMSHPRSFISVGKNSRAEVIESFVGQEGEGYFTNAVTEVRLDEAAELNHHKLQHEDLSAMHVALMQVDQKADSRLRSHYFSFGSAIARNEVGCMLGGEQIETTLNGLYMPTGNQLMDCRTRIDHAHPHCNSYELYKGILDDQAKGVFNGKIFVHQDAQKTDAKQSNQALLLSDDAVVNTKPQLEIYADDVRCTHGATIGELDEQALYYLRSRGIPIGLARKMLIFAFANDVVQGVEVPAVRQHLESILLSNHGLPDVY